MGARVEIFYINVMGGWGREEIDKKEKAIFKQVL